jgi:glycosyltransferase involved in cell wall biosynthesis
MRSPELFIGITSWNSSAFLPTCIQSILKTTFGIEKTIFVLDNASSDGSADIARDLGAQVLIKQCYQPDALNTLFGLSRSPYTLLIHSDVVLLHSQWFAICREKLTGSVALVSPQDIGCGPYTRPLGKGKPESSFMFFDTAKARKLRETRWVRRFRLPFPAQRINFYVSHVTHALPARLAACGYTWNPMKVHPSPTVTEPIWTPNFEPYCWTDELAYLQYGLGNFYSLDGTITHYHNWFDRILTDDASEVGAARIDQGGLPTDYLKESSRRFLNDYDNGVVALPDPSIPEREPAYIRAPLSSAP